MESQIWTPTQYGTKQLFPASPNHPFFLKSHPKSWDFVYFDVKGKKGTEKKGFFLPSLSLERVVPGVNGIRQIPHPKSTEIGDASARIGKIQTQHWTWLDPSRYNYVATYEVRGGKYHVPVWINYTVKFGQKIKSIDFEKKYKFVIQILKDGTIPEPVPFFIEEMISVVERRRTMYASDKHPTPAVEAKLKAIDGEVADMRDALARLQADGLSVYDTIVWESQK